MPDNDTMQLKALVPAKDFKLSKVFYQDMGFEMPWSNEDLAHFSLGDCHFLLQNFYVKEHAHNFVMHLLVKDADAWWHKLQQNRISCSYGVALGNPEDRPWGLRDFTLIDPSGVLWRIGSSL